MSIWCLAAPIMRKDSIMYVSLVIPCYNEGKSIGRSVESIISTLDMFYTVFYDSYEIVLVIEKCKDNTLEVANDLAKKHSKVRVLENDEAYGKGYSVRRGVLESLGQYIFVIDADLPINLHRYIRIMMMLVEHPKTAAVYCTALWDKVSFKKRPKMRAMASIGLFTLRKIILRQSVSDSQFGCKVYEGETARIAFSEITVNNYLYDVYVTDLLLSKGYFIDECAVRVDEFAKTSTVRFSSIIDSFNTFVKYAFFERRRLMANAEEA